MANNKMFMCCLKCLSDDSTTMEDCFYYFMRYDPTMGWYTSRTHVELDSFLGMHKHGTLLGEYLQLYPESRMPGYGEDKAEILKIVATNIQDIQNQ